MCLSVQNHVLLLDSPECTITKLSLMILCPQSVDHVICLLEKRLARHCVAMFGLRNVACCMTQTAPSAEDIYLGHAEDNALIYV